MVRSDELIEEENIIETAQIFFLSSDWPFQENLSVKEKKKTNYLQRAVKNQNLL